MATQRPSPADVKTVGILGTGVIGSAWALHFLRMGKDVLVWDSAPGAEQRLRERVAEKWTIMEQLGLRDGASRENMRFAESLEQFCAEAQIIQESTPEDLAAKQALFAQLDELTPEHVVISSSTSGLLMTDIQKQCANPGRTVVCHPFNPPYMIPFCEVVGGEQSDDDAVDWTAEFFQLNGKQVARMKRELPGFIGNRLQDAIWREALHMVDNDECSVADIDKAIAYGPGLRWAIMGPCANMALCGGEGGMQRMLDHFGPSLKEPWTRLVAPELTDTLYRDMVDGFEDAKGGRSMAELAQELDDCLIRIQSVLREYREAHGLPH